MALPPSRYRVEERGRRLVTIDTRTGQEYGGDTVIGPAAASSQSLVVPTAPKDLIAQRSALSAVTVARPLNDAGPPMAALNLKPGAGGKLVVLVISGLMLAAFLIMTKLWIVVVIALTIAPVRSAALTWGKAALRKYLDQAATG